MAIAAVRVQVPSRVRIRRKVRAIALTFLFLPPESDLLERKGEKQKSRPLAWLFFFQYVRAGLTVCEEGGNSRPEKFAVGSCSWIRFQASN